MQFGLFMMPLHPPHRPFADGYERDVAQIERATAQRVGGHARSRQLQWSGPSQSIAVASRSAAATTRRCCNRWKKLSSRFNSMGR